MERNYNHRIWIGIILVVLGALFLMDNYDVINFDLPYWIFRWQSILIIIGLIVLGTSGNRSAGFVLIIIGAIAWAPELWPVLLIGIGFYVLYRRKDDKTPDPQKGETSGNFSDSDVINEVAIFGGGKKMIQTNNFRGGKVTAVFGGNEIDLTESKLAEGIHIIDVFAMFGGSDIFVPRDWNVKIDVVPIFGGFSDKRMKDPNRVFDPEKKIVIKGLVVFGGGSLKN